MNEKSLPLVSSESKLLAYQSYQVTMRQFLQLQEEIMFSLLTTVDSDDFNYYADDTNNISPDLDDFKVVDDTQFVENKIINNVNEEKQFININQSENLLDNNSNQTLIVNLENKLKINITEAFVENEDKCDRYLMEGQLELLPPLNLEDSSIKLTGLFIITEGDKIVTNRLKNNIEKLGGQTTIITQIELDSPEKINQKIVEIQAQKPKITALIHLASIEFFPIPENLIQWQQLAQIQSKSLFQIIQNLAEDLQQNQTKIIATSLMGGYWGRNQQLTPGLALGGSHSGLLKTMMIEWENVKAKMIDFDHNSFTQIPSIILQELINWDDKIEISYSNKQRFIFDVVKQPVIKNLDLANQNKLYIPQSDWIVLSIGGARGITSEIIKEIVKPNMTLILVGRSPKPSPENKITEGITDVNQLKNILIQQVLSEGEKPVPIEIEKRITKILTNRAINENITYLQKLGVKVEYHSLDVRDESEFGSFINNIYNIYGKIDAVIQGAGIIQDKLIVDKTLSSFEQVFSTKVDSTFILTKYLRPESLKLMVLFASIAGRTGNKGQCDYASANEVVNRMAWRMREIWLNTRIIAINWGPWDVTGMASAEVKQQFRDRGVIPISPKMGREFFTEELYYGNNDQVEIISGIYKNLVAKEVNNANNLLLDKNILPLVNGLNILKQEQIWFTEKTITIENEPYLLDHCLDDNPVVPAAVAMELMAEFSQEIFRDWQVITVENLRVLKGIILTDKQPITINLVAEIKEKNEKQLVIKAQIQDNNKRKLYQAEIILSKQNLTNQIIDNIPELKQLSPIDINIAYPQCCFHGEKFQLIKDVEHFGELGALAKVEKSYLLNWLKYDFLTNYNPDKINWIFDPGLVDSALQMSLIWTHIYLDKGTLPTKFGTITKYQNLIKSHHHLQLIFIVTKVEDNSMQFSAYYTDQNNQIILAINDIEMTCSSALKRLV